MESEEISEERQMLNGDLEKQAAEDEGNKIWFVPIPLVIFLTGIKWS